MGLPVKVAQGGHNSLVCEVVRDGNLSEPVHDGSAHVKEICVARNGSKQRGRKKRGVNMAGRTNK